MATGFSDGFAAYLDAIAGAEVLILRTGISTRSWQVSSRPLFRTMLQFGSDGSPRIYHGVTDPHADIVIIQTTDVDGIKVDGVPVRCNQMVFLPAGCHFTFTCDLPASWLTWSIPPTFLADVNVIPVKAPGASVNSLKYLFDLDSNQARSFVLLATKGWELASAEHPSLKEAMENELMDELKKARGSAATIQLPLDRSTAPETLVFKALAYIRSRRNDYIRVDDLVAHTNTGYRTLLRAFEYYLDVSPKRYLKLHQLNMVNQAICIDAGASARILDIIADHGVSEFGRFAGEYKSLFGESPSETAFRSRTIAASEWTGTGERIDAS